uniref:Uncharacterized protein n=1 Tax=Candidatus Kentrum eta TaxID=2126337 RepID=A0A450UH57_9GAMM|nr:MAG: hypothetical protein BECKH772A_GA0070896_1002412 [Candidatus Kentron sp. H]VFJ91863.1 MAG: hypothetical protein BECKH772B_GA0070898_1002210 [Candidatus Kentron sp. H]VFJ98527.1 MAG: hypothetical protein BECKH772C_GA0070978_1002211 [Candidatus Kentron sp. H]
MERRYLIDENTTPALGDQLRRRQPALEVMSVGDESAPPKGTLDPDILLWIQAHGFTLGNAQSQIHAGPSPSAP